MLFDEEVGPPSGMKILWQLLSKRLLSGAIVVPVINVLLSMKQNELTHGCDRMEWQPAEKSLRITRFGLPQAAHNSKSWSGAFDS
jgi:hypothetical protein